MKTNYFKITLLLIIGAFLFSCTNFTKVEPPENRISSDAIFQEEGTARAAVMGCYAKLSSTNLPFSNAGNSIYLGMYADELSTNLTSASSRELVNSTVTPSNGILLTNLWRPAYENIYQINLCIKNLRATKAFSADVKNQLIGECLVLRSFCYMHLITAFGDVPLITSDDYNQNSTSPKAPAKIIADHIEADLLEARTVLNPAYPSIGKFRVNRHVASALLARLSLFQEKWADAVTYSTEVIASGSYAEVPVLSNVFLETSSEAIWQLTIDGQTFNTMEGSRMVPLATGTGLPSYPLTSRLLQSFEASDKRIANWIGKKTVNNVVHNYPAKFKSRGTIVTAKVEQPIVIRLSEMYLTRAEGLARQNQLGAAVEDLHVTRQRAGLSKFVSDDQNTVINSILQERRLEFFAENGIRFFDLKRTKLANAALNYKSGWQETDINLPIPESEIRLNPNLVQNQGY